MPIQNSFEPILIRNELNFTLSPLSVSQDASITKRLDVDLTHIDRNEMYEGIKI